MFVRLVGIFIAVVGCGRLSAQCDAIQFSLPDTVCQWEHVNVAYNAPWANEVKFRFSKIPRQISAFDAIGNPGGVLSSPEGLTMYRGDTLALLAKSPNVHNLKRLTFQHGLEGSATAHDYVVTGAQVNSITDSDIKFVKFNDTLYGFTTIRTGNKIYRYTFYDGIMGDTVAGTDLGNPLNALTNARDLDLHYFNGKYYLAVISLNAKLVVYDLGTSPLNSPLSYVLINLNSGSTPMTGGVGVRLESHCNDLVAFVSGQNSNGLKRVRFGSSLTSSPLIELVPNANGWSQTYSPTFSTCNGRVCLYLKRYNPYSFSVVEFADSINQPIGTLISKDFSTIASTVSSKALAMASVDTAVYYFTLNTPRNSIYRFADKSRAGAAVVSQTSSTLTFAATDTGWVYVQMVAQDSSGFDALFDSVYVKPGIVAAFSVSDVCQNDSVHFQNQTVAFGGQPYASLWQMSTGQTSSAQSPTFYFNTPDTIFASLHVSLPNGCFDTAAHSFIVRPLPFVSISDDSICAGTQFSPSTVISSADTIAEIWWSTGTGDTLADTGLWYIYLDTGMFTMVLEAATVYGCTRVDSATIFVKSTPLAKFDVQSTCIGEATAFTNLATSAYPFTQLWDFGDGNTSALFSPLHMYADTGSYMVRLKTNSSNGCADSSAIEIRISEKPDLQVSVPKGGLCQNTPFNFGAAVFSTDTLRYSVLSLGTDTIYNPQGQVTATDTGVVQTQYTAVVGTACAADTQFLIRINPQPILIPFVSDTCLNQQVVWSAMPAIDSGKIVSLTWEFGDGFVANDFVVSHSINDSFDFWYKLNATSDSGCAFALSDTLQAYPSPIIKLKFNTPFCTGLPLNNASEVTIANGFGIASNVWTVVNPAGAENSFTTDDSLVSNSPGLHKILLASQSNKGCLSVDSTELSITQSPQPVLNDDSICIGSAITFSDGYSGTNYTHNWEFGDGSFSLLPQPSHYYADTGVFTVSIKLEDNTTSCYGTAHARVVVTQLPELVYSIGSLCSENRVLLKAEADAGRYDHLKRVYWILDNEPLAVGDSVWVMTPPAGEYLLMVRAETDLGCTAIAQNEIDLLPLPAGSMSIKPATYGRAPFTVEASVAEIANQSEVVWTVEEDTIGMSETVSFTLSTNGVYSLEATVFDTAGCMKTLKRTIYVSDEEADLSFDRLEYQPGDSGEFVLRVSNLGATPINRFNYRIRLNNGTVFSAYGKGLILPKSSAEFSWRVSLNDSLSFWNYACADLTALDGQPDANPENNTRCYARQAGIRPVYPNPFTDFVHLELYSLYGKKLKIEIMDQTGRMVDEMHYSLTQDAFQRYLLTLGHLSSGVYAMRISVDGNLQGIQPLVKR
ncbi:MAG: hypothetical protein Kow0075_09210 [Salibacteraceae bacterium]